MSHWLRECGKLRTGALQPAASSLQQAAGCAWAIPITSARLALPNGAQQPRRRLESADDSVGGFLLQVSPFGSLTAILFNFCTDATQMIRALCLAKIAFHLCPESVYRQLESMQMASARSSSALPPALVISVNMMRAQVAAVWPIKQRTQKTEQATKFWYASTVWNILIEQVETEETKFSH